MPLGRRVRWAAAAGGRLRHCGNNWRKLGANEWVLSTISEGYKIPFETLPFQAAAPSNPPAEGAKKEILMKEAEELLGKGAIGEAEHCANEYVSPYFAIPKLRSPGKYRPILNLKIFNANIKKFKFKMETLSHIRDWIKPGSYCISIDLKDAFLHVPICSRFHKYLRFEWQGTLYQWKVLVFGLRCSPRVLTKVLKPVMAFLRSNFGILISIYLDDMLNAQPG